MSKVSQWAFGPPQYEITVINAEELLAQLSIFLSGWPFRRIETAEETIADIKVVALPDKRFVIKVSGPGGRELYFDNVFDAADGLANSLISSFVLRRQDAVCINASSTMVGPHLAVILGDSFAENNNVALQICAAGYRCFGDDQLVLAQSSGGVDGLCLGLTPKVKLPLPLDCGAGFMEYIEAFTEIRNDKVVYLKLWDGEAASFMEGAPIGALIILDRRMGEPCSFTPISKPAIVQALVPRCFAPHLDVDELISNLTALATDTIAYRLRFSNSGDAAAAIIKKVKAPNHEVSEG